MKQHNNKYINLPIQEIIKEYDLGKTPNELGEKYYVCKSTIYRRIKEFHTAKKLVIQKEERLKRVNVHSKGGTK